MLAHARSSQDEHAHDRLDRPPIEVADIVRAHGEAFGRAHVVLPEQHAVLRDIVRCRTAALGGHADVCDACGHREVSYNSCRNRHCPKCQSVAQVRWVEQRMERILPTHYFHVVFTVPSSLRSLFMANRETLFQALFASAAEALLELGRDPRRLGAELGITSVLHTWTRELTFHPHVHSIVTGGGLALDGERWVGTRPGFLFHVRVIGALFRGKLLDRIKELRARGLLRFDGAAARMADQGVFRRLLDKVYLERWVVYSKPPFGGPEEVFKYLGRYTHRVGISNRRLVSFDDEHVTFRTRGQQTTTVTPEQFLGRFLLHVLPPGFVKIRHYGLFAPGNVHTKLEVARRLLSRSTPETTTDAPAPVAPRDFRDILLALTGLDLRACKRCGGGPVVRQPLDPALDGQALPSPDTS